MLSFSDQEKKQMRIVGISGGDLQSTDSLNRYALQLTEIDCPNVLFVPTASDDEEGYIEKIEKYYDGLGCRVDVLYLCDYPDSETVISEKIDRADLIYIGGGDTESMLCSWKKYGVDRKLLEACAAGKVLTGISAGLICWFAFGCSDSDYFKDPNHWDFKFVEGLGLFPLMVCPHYDEEGRNRFDAMLTEANTGMDGLALENDTAVVIENGCIRVIKADDQKQVFYFRCCGGRYEKKLVDVPESQLYTMKTIQLTRAGLEDAEQIHEMQQRAFDALYQKYQDHETSPAKETVERIIAKLNHPATYFYLIHSDGEIVGAIRVVDKKDFCTPKRISPLFILPEYWNSGFGQMAIEEVEKIHGSTNWKLDTVLQEKKNCYLYEKMGYHQTGETEVINERLTLVYYQKK